MLSAKRPSLERKEKLLRDVKDEIEPRKRLNAVIEESLYEKIREQCFKERRSISEKTKELWIEYLNRSRP